MTKRIWAFLIVLALMMATWAGLAEETSQEPEVLTSGDYEYIVQEDGTAEITRYRGKDKQLTIPATLDGHKIASIGETAFSWCTSLTDITIPDSVTNIGQNPFKHCDKLISINVSPEHPDLATIDGVLFSKPDKRLICYPCAYTDISYTIPTGTLIIGDYAFNSCSTLTSIMIPDSVTSIGEFAFTNCSSLASVTIPDSVTSIGDGAFYSCSSLTSITIPESVTSIGDYAFDSCSSLTSITIPDSVTSIGKDAFAECPKITLTVGRDSYALQYCIDNNLKYMYPDSLDWLNN